MKRILKTCDAGTLLLGIILVLLTVSSLLIAMNRNGKEQLETRLEKFYENRQEQLGFTAVDEESEEKDDPIQEIYAVMIFSFLLASFSGLGFWFRHKEKSLQVRRSLGAGNVRVLAGLFGAFLSLWAGTWLLGVILAEVFRVLWIPYGLTGRDYLLSAAITLIPGLVLLIFYGVRLAVGRLRMQYRPRRLGAVNLVIILQFVCFFWLFCKVSTYYININRNTWVQNAKNGYQYCTLHEDWDEEDIGVDPAMAENVKKALGQVNAEDGFTYMAVTRSQSVSVDQSALKEHFGEKSYDDFLYLSQYPGYYGEPGHESEYEVVTQEGMAMLSVCQMDQNAAEHFIGRADGGRMFTEKEYRLGIHDREMPVMLGAAYKSCYEVGDVIDVNFIKQMKARVVGFLPKNTLFVTDATLEQRGGEPQTLDYSIIIPYFDVEGAPMSQEDELFLQMNYYNRLQGTLLFPGDATGRELLRAQQRINEIYTANGLYTVSPINATEGTRLFMRETRESVNIIASLLLLMALFGVFSLCVSMVNKLNYNIGRYAVQIVNGRRLSGIAICYVLEILLLIAVAAGITGHDMLSRIRDNIQFLWLLMAIAGIVAVPCIAVIGVRLRGVDMEQLLRRKER